MRDFVPQGELADDNIVFALQLAVPDAVLELQPKASLGDFTTGKGNAVGGEFLSATESIFSKYLRNIVSGHETFLAAK